MTWRPAPGFGGRYEVSDTGRVRSVRTGRLLTDARVDGGGYPIVALYATPTAKPHQIKTHRLVALAFLGEPPAGMEVRHLDGNPANNVIANLAYGTHSENMRDKVRHGTDHNAAKTHCPQRHPYVAGNIYMDRGSRTCRTCKIAAVARSRRRRTVAA